MPKITQDQRDVLALDVDPTTTNDATARTTTGRLFIFEGKIYRYVQVLNAVAVTNGVCLMPVAVGATTVTADASGGASGNALDANMCAGVAVGSITQNYYGFILVKGYHSAVKTDGNVAGAGPLVVSGDGTAIAWAPTSAGATLAQLKLGAKTFAFAQGADTSASTVAAWVDCRM